MSWTLPTPLLLLSGVVAVWPLAAVARRPTLLLRLVAEAFGTALAVFALVQLAGTRRVIAHWLLEQWW
jgi:hypothetical protein